MGRHQAGDAAYAQQGRVPVLNGVRRPENAARRLALASVCRAAWSMPSIHPGPPST